MKLSPCIVCGNSRKFEIFRANTATKITCWGCETSVSGDDLSVAINTWNETNVAPELLPCPFCGGAASLTGSEYKNGTLFIGCNNQDCNGMTKHYASITEAVAAWNKRS